MKAAASTTDLSLAMTENSENDSLDLMPSGGTPFDNLLLCLRPMHKNNQFEKENDAVVSRGIPEGEFLFFCCMSATGTVLSWWIPSLTRSSSLTFDDVIETTVTEEESAKEDELKTEDSAEETSTTTMAEPLDGTDLLLAFIWVLFSVLIFHGHKIELVKHVDTIQAGVTAMVTSLQEKMAV